MSYYNQPDHELLDRRDETARQILLRLSRARTVACKARLSQTPVPSEHDGSRDGLWLAEASRRGIPAPDPQPLAAAGCSVRRVWRKHYVAAVIDEAERPAVQALSDLGFDVILFEDPVGWNAAFARLASVLGCAS
jgi:hypothetical protein